MSKALDLLSKGIQKGFQKADELADDIARRRYEKEEWEERQKESYNAIGRTNLQNAYNLNPEYMERLGYHPDMTDEELEDLKNGKRTGITLPSDISDAQVEIALQRFLDMDIDIAEEVAEKMSSFSIKSNAAIIKEINELEWRIAHIDKEEERYQLVSKAMYEECVEAFGKSRASDWKHFDFNKPTRIIKNALEKRQDDLMKYIISRKHVLDQEELHQVEMLEAKHKEYLEQQRKKQEELRLKRQEAEEKRKKLEAEERELRKIEEAKEAEERAKIAHQMKYHKWVACGFWVAWLIAFIMLFINMEEWYEYVMTAIICIVTGIALGLYTFSTQIVHRNISLVLWITWTILMFYSIYDAEWWGYLLAIIIGGIVAIPLFFYQMYQAAKQ